MLVMVSSRAVLALACRLFGRRDAGDLAPWLFGRIAKLNAKLETKSSAVWRPPG
jgi:hypothetical protein